MSDHIFISYSRADLDAVENLYQDLIDNGINCWLDVKNIHPSEDWDAALQNAIEGCSAVIVVCTPNSMNSKNVQAEWHYGFELKKTLYPLLLKPCNLPFRLKIFQHVDFVALGYKEGVKLLLETIPHVSENKDIVVEDRVETSGTNVEALLKRSLENWKAFGWLLDKNAFQYIDKERESINQLDSTSRELLYLSARQYRQNMDYWLAQLQSDDVALDRVEDLIIDEINEKTQFRDDHLAGFASDRLLKKLSNLIALSPSVEAIEVLLNVSQSILSMPIYQELDFSKFEQNLLDVFEREQSEAIARALGWLNSDTILQTAQDIAQSSFFDLFKAENRLILMALVNMTRQEAFDILSSIEFKGFRYIHAGWFEMGGESKSDLGVFVHQAFVPSFWLAKYPVSEKEFEQKQLLADTEKQDDLPLHFISWSQASQFAQLMAERLNLPIALPTEAMWEKAASWNPETASKERFPWGSAEDASRANTTDNNQGGVSAVGKFSPMGDSPYGIADMVGNVWEWTSSNWQPYPYHARDGREERNQDRSRVQRVLRGSSYYARRGYLRGVFTRAAFEESYAFKDAGMRLAIVIDR